MPHLPSISLITYLLLMVIQGPPREAKCFMLGTIIIQVDIFSLLESLDYGMPYPLWTYHYLLQLIREKYIILWTHFYLTFNMITHAHFIFYAHVVDAPTHPTPLYCNSNISNVIL